MVTVGLSTIKLTTTTSPTNTTTSLTIGAGILLISFSNNLNNVFNRLKISHKDLAIMIRVAVRKRIVLSSIY